MKWTKWMRVGTCCAAGAGWAIMAWTAEPATPCCGGATASCCALAAGTNAPGDVARTNATAAATNVVPRLVDLGAGRCILCKLMAPILDDLKKTCAGRLDVVFIDVSKNMDEARKYGIKLIPTQIFYGVDGQELFRHEGFFAKEDILAKWKELGVELPVVKEEAPK